MFISEYLPGDELVAAGLASRELALFCQVTLTVEMLGNRT